MIQVRRAKHDEVVECFDVARLDPSLADGIQIWTPMHKPLYVYTLGLEDLVECS